MHDLRTHSGTLMGAYPLVDNVALTIKSTDNDAKLVGPLYDVGQIPHIIVIKT
jgi:hypothetical protein